jgi:hypothetical protein
LLACLAVGAGRERVRQGSVRRASQISLAGEGIAELIGLVTTVTGLRAEPAVTTCYCRAGSAAADSVRPGFIGSRPSICTVRPPRLLLARLRENREFLFPVQAVATGTH